MFTTTRISQKNSQDPLCRSRAEISLEVTLTILICLYVGNWYSEMQTVMNIFIQNLTLTDVFMATVDTPFWMMT